jgi:hypothetical protein
LKVHIITQGYVEQVLNLSTGLFESSEFIADDIVEYLDDKGENITENMSEDEDEEFFEKISKHYFGYPMIKPTPKNQIINNRK